MSQQVKHCYINHASVICALGDTRAEIEEKLFGPNSAQCFTETDSYAPGGPLPLGLVNTKLPALDGYALKHRTRNNQLLLASLRSLEEPVNTLIKKHGADRIGVIIGSSTSGIYEGEQAVASLVKEESLPQDYCYQQQEVGAPSDFVADYFNITGPAWTISTACTSGAKALASAARLIRLGVCDAVIAGGGDSLCGLTVGGFSALSAVSDKICQPFSRNRAGINIGEAAALFLLSAQPSDCKLAGVGESSDAHHISAPHPNGDGAERAMSSALKAAKLSPAEVDYVNLHGTATAHNDSMEAKAVHRIFGAQVPCSSTKPFTGHTLGAAGALEAYFCWLILKREDGRLPSLRWDGEYDDSLDRILLAEQSVTGKVQRVISNSFAFGGNNIALCMERCEL